MSFGVWISNFFGKDKLAQNLDPKTKIINSTTKSKQEEETSGATYDAIFTNLREMAIKDESISMLANAYGKGIFGANVSIQNVTKSDTINNEIESFIKLFLHQDNFEIQGRFHFNYWARFWAMDLIREGGILLRKHKVTPKVAKKKGWKIPYKIEVLEISSINFDYTDKEKNIYNGVELTADNKPYKLHFKSDISKAEKTSLLFNDLIMFSNITRSTQYNGVSAMYTSLPTIRRQQQHTQAEVENATQQANVSDVYKTKISDTIKAQVSGDFELDLASASNIPTREISDKLPEKVAKIIDVSEDYKRLDRGSYTSAFDSLTKFANTRIAANSGLTLDEYTGDLSQLTFHGGQVAQIKNDETYSIIRNDMIELIIKPLIEDMLKWSYATSYLNTKPKNIDLAVIVTPRRSAQPTKDALADKANLLNKTTTRSNVIKLRLGINYKDFLKEYEADEIALLEADAKILKRKLELEKEHSISFTDIKPKGKQ